MGGQVHAFFLGQCFARMLKEVLLLDAGWTLEPQVHDSRELVRGETFTSSQLQNLGLVALGQPHQLSCGGRRQQPHL